MSATVGLILRIAFLVFLYTFLVLAIWMLWRRGFNKLTVEISIPSLTYPLISTELMTQTFPNNEVLIGRPGM